MKKYDGAFKRSGERSAYAAPPLPAYLEDSGSLLVSKTSEFMMKDDEEEEVYDTCYHLLKLFCEKGYPLKLILNPTTITANSLDHRLRCIWSSFLWVLCLWVYRSRLSVVFLLDKLWGFFALLSWEVFVQKMVLCTTWLTAGLA